MTIYLQGTSPTLVAQWREYAPDGPLTNVTGVTITITPLSGGAPVVGPTSAGVGNPATGTNTYTWAIGGAQAVGDYLVVWEGTDGDGILREASGIVTVATAASAGSPSGLCAPWEPIWCDIPTGSEAVTGNANAIQAATEALWAATAMQFGLCTETIRPCRRSCAGGWPFADSWWEYGSWPRPLLYDGAWYNITCGGCSGGCSCTDLEEALLPGPVYDILQVKVDGVPLLPTAYRLDGNLLVRVDGGRWPVCQDMGASDTEANTWSVTARFGQPVPMLGRQAVGELAQQIARACAGEDCMLPANVQQLVRQGVTISIGEGMLDRLYFGNLFIQTFNPGGLRARPRVFDVDGPSWRRVGP